MKDYKSKFIEILHRFGWNRLSRPERIRIKAFVCVLGVAFLLFLLVGHFFVHVTEPETETEEEVPPEPYVPVISELRNVWIMEVSGESLKVFCDGEERDIFFDASCQPDVNAREQVADLVLTDGLVSEVKVKTEKIRGRILGADDASIETEEYGVLPLADDFRGYRIYNTLEMCTQRDLAFGYDFTDLVLEDGMICGILMVKEEAMEYIRVLIKTADFEESIHQELVLTSDTDFVVSYGEYGDRVQEYHEAGEEVAIAADGAYFAGGRVIIEPKVLTGKMVLKNVGRSQGVPKYRGRLELTKGEQGFAVVNTVLLEEYLYSVIPSEMPASYPREALKAQAVCARTYAYRHMLHAAYPAYGAHLDDSTSYQVYNNISEQEATTTAVKETYGQLLYTDGGEPAGTFYYSTSCGVGSDANVWKTQEAQTITYLKAEAVNPAALQETQDIGIGEYLRDEDHFAAFISTVNPEDFEADEGWYRWTYQVEKVDPEYLCEVLKKRYQADSKLVLTLNGGSFVSREIADFKEIYDMSIAARGAGGVADELVLTTDSGIYKVISEHNIRCVLCNGIAKVVRRDGKKIDMPTILPSGFFILETGKKDGNVVAYNLVGGGFGHGVGMSQNAAKAMGKQGFTSDRILLFFYKDCSLQKIY